MDSGRARNPLSFLAYRRLFIARAVSSAGSYMQIVAVTALVFAGAIPYSLNCPVISLVGPYTVPEQYRQAALAQSSMMFNVTRLVGAVAGGFLVHLVSIGAAFAVNAFTYFHVAFVLVGTPLVSEVRRTPGAGSPAGEDPDADRGASAS